MAAGKRTLTGSFRSPATSADGQSPSPLTRSVPVQWPVSVEAYLLDFDGDLYHRRVRLELLDRLRDEQRFESIDALIAQIHADVAAVRGIHS